LTLPRGYDLTKDPAFKTWIERREGRRGREYDVEGSSDIICVERWTQYLDMTLSELVELRRQHLATTAEETRSWEESKMEEFMSWLSKQKIPRSKKGKLARGTVVRHWAVIRSFYSYHKLPFTDKAPQSWIETEYHPCTMEDMREVYKYADLRGRAVLSILISTGLSNEDVAELNWGSGNPSVLSQISNDRAIVRLARAKTKVKFRCIFGKNVMRDLRTYTQSRKNSGETITPESQLIIGEFSGVTDYKDVWRIVQKPAKQADRGWLTPKLVRKLFNQIVKNKGMDDHAEYWMGHKMAPERRAYFENMPDAMLMHAYETVEKDLELNEGAGVRDEKDMKLQWQLDMLRMSMPDLYREVQSMMEKKSAEGRGLSTADVLQYISAELAKREPTGGLAWIQLSKKEKLNRVLGMLAEVLGSE